LVFYHRISTVLRAGTAAGAREPYIVANDRSEAITDGAIILKQNHVIFTFDFSDLMLSAIVGFTAIILHQ
jgi:hypothetical protein